MRVNFEANHVAEYATDLAPVSPAYKMFGLNVSGEGAGTSWQNPKTLSHVRPRRERPGPGESEILVHSCGSSWVAPVRTCTLKALELTVDWSRRIDPFGGMEGEGIDGLEIVLRLDSESHERLRIGLHRLVG